ncbi:YkgJ family cysteine cluster protein [Achromobacter sp. AONIH1]|uniref:YkgJ family cysteine cluster protein n=1 Tax=Achromobacter sp. AONIH1 TaxID=1758194 RepID=UPI000CD0891A|nr:YkgJ family cysteine cluster protein [Achromobacter sp. AONIH1]AUT46101.1 YkgJ family cysteine cluster protein [Achromobacter sp. AONIH1]
MSLLETSPITFVSPAVLAGDDPAANPCLDCGACCSHFRVSFYCGELAGENGGQVPVELVTQLSPLRACMKGTEMGGGRCISLRGELGKPSIHCAIYENRPTPCREFDIWLPDGTPNPDCQRLRLALGLPAVPPRPDAENDPLGPQPQHPDQPAAA